MIAVTRDAQLTPPGATKRRRMGRVTAPVRLRVAGLGPRPFAAVPEARR